MHTSGKREQGLSRWIYEWEQDFDSEVRFLPQSVMASENIIVIEGLFKNPPHDPDHCPPAGTYVLFHDNGKAHRVHIHYAPRQRSKKP